MTTHSTNLPKILLYNIFYNKINKFKEFKKASKKLLALKTLFYTLFSNNIHIVLVLFFYHLI